MTKVKASLTHLLISILVVSSFLYIVYFIWYPKPLFEISQVIEPIKLLILIDVIVGPMLMFIVYKKGKSTLIMDIAVIVLLQVAALAYGAYTIYSGRPSIIVMNNREFNYIVLEHTKDQKIPDELKESIFSGPKYAYLQNLITMDINGSLESAHTIKDFNNELLAFSLSKENMIAKFPVKEKQILEFEEKYKDQELYYFTLNHKDFKYFVAYSNKQKRFVDMIRF